METARPAAGWRGLGGVSSPKLRLPSDLRAIGQMMGSEAKDACLGTVWSELNSYFVISLHIQGGWTS